jgi:hypothetical protein
MPPGHMQKENTPLPLTCSTSEYEAGGKKAPLPPKGGSAGPEAPLFDVFEWTPVPCFSIDGAATVSPPLEGGKGRLGVR